MFLAPVNVSLAEGNVYQVVANSPVVFDALNQSTYQRFMGQASESSGKATIHLVTKITNIGSPSCQRCIPCQCANPGVHLSHDCSSSTSRWGSCSCLCSSSSSLLRLWCARCCQCYLGVDADSGDCSLQDRICCCCRFQVEREKFKVYDLFMNVPMAIIKRLSHIAQHQLETAQAQLESAELGGDDDENRDITVDVRLGTDDCVKAMRKPDA